MCLLTQYVYTKAPVGKDRRLVQSKDRKIDKQAVINSLDSSLRFYIKHIY